MENNETTIINAIYLLLTMIVPMLVMALVIEFHMKAWIPFVNEKRYINMEMGRATGKKKEYWKRRLDILYLLHIPIVGKIIIDIKYRR